MNKTTEKDASIKLARKRMNVIEMAKPWGISPKLVGEEGWTAPVSMSGKAFPNTWARWIERSSANTEKPAKHHNS